MSHVPAPVHDVLQLEVADRIATVTLDRPRQRNAMTLAMWSAMPALFASLERDADVRAIVLTGSGDDFCAGADIAEFGRVRDDVEQAAAYEVAVDACCDAITQVGKPTIAVIDGYCLGGGAHLAMSCDFRYATTRACFGIPAARLSVVYGVSATRKLLALVGLASAKRILFGAQRFDAAEARRIGFVDHVADAALSDAMADARGFAQAMAINAPLTLVGAKRILNALGLDTGTIDVDEAEALIAAAAGSADYREGRAAFAERRNPVFEGR